MHFEALEARMRPYEDASDRSASADAYLLARLDGRGFHKLLTARPELDAPFDLRVRDIMIATADHLTRGGSVSYGYTQSDEISLLFRRDEPAGGRKLHALVARLVGEASAKCTLLLGQLAFFDCRLVELTQPESVVDYFLWRQADALRHALRAHCEHALRRAGASAGEAAEQLHGLGPDEQRRLLAGLDVDFEALPDWQKYGAALRWEPHDTPVAALRRRLRVELELPTGDTYAALLREQVEQAAAPEP